jgi:hypothetical protein
MRFFLIYLIFCSFSVFADTVRIYNPTNIIVSGTIVNASFDLISDAPSGDATADTAPAHTYIPIQSGVAGQLDYSTLKLTAGVGSLFNINANNHSLSFPLLLTVGGTAKYLYAAVRGGAAGTSYYVSARSGSTYSNITNSQVDMSILPKDICKSVIVNNISNICSAGGALDPTSVTGVVFKPMLYFFLTDQVFAVDGSSVIDPANASYSGGVFFESQMSNRIFDPTAIIVSFDSLKKGDGRLIGDFSANTTMDTTIFNKVIAYQYVETATPIVTNIAVGAATAGAIIDRTISNSQSGEFTLNQLTNGTAYKLSLAFEDKFLFATALSTSRMETPVQIEELLKKQACYILTAGFGEEHYVTNYFRSYRDHILANSWLGRKFIRLYYGTAPKYAIIIYRHKSIRFLVRAMAYTLYFFFNHTALIAFLSLSCYFLDILRKNKVLFQNNRL